MSVGSQIYSQFARDLKKNQYSVLRAIRAAQNDQFAKLAPLEAEISQEITKATGGVARPGGFFLPVSLFADAQRDLTVASGAGGGYLVSTTNAAEEVSALRGRSLVVKLGAQIIPGLVGNFSLPKVSTGASGSWQSGEGVAPAEQNPVFGQVNLTPKTVTANIDVSRLLQLQSSPAVERVLFRDLRAELAVQVDRAAIQGTGAAGQPLGIVNTAGAGSVTGTSIAWAGVVEFETDVSSANALIDERTCGYLAHPTVRDLLRKREKATGSGMIWNGAEMNGYTAMATTNVPSGTMLFGDFATVVIGEWGVLELAVNPFAAGAFQAGISSVRAFYTVDVGLRYPGAFSVASSIT